MISLRKGTQVLSTRAYRFVVHGTQYTELSTRNSVHGSQCTDLSARISVHGYIRALFY